MPELGLPPTKVHRNSFALPRLGEQHGAPLSASHQLMMRWMPDVSSSSSGQTPPLPQLGVPSEEEGMQDTCDFAGHSAALTAHSASALPLFGRLVLVGMETLRFPKLRRAPPLNIVVRQVSEPFASLSRIARATSGVCPASYERIVNYYCTIRAHAGSFTSPGFMTNRNKTELPQSLLCDPVLQQPVSARGKPLHEFRAVSPHFAEWLFGFPYGWTDGTLGKCTDLATHLVSQWPQRSRKHRVASVFTGIGGLDFGLSPWVEPALYIEQDEDALAVLHARMFDGSLPCCPVVKDVCDVGSANLPADIDGIVAGFPCTDTSGAGLRQGMQGAETHLVIRYDFVHIPLFGECASHCADAFGILSDFCRTAEPRLRLCVGECECTACGASYEAQAVVFLCCATQSASVLLGRSFARRWVGRTFVHGCVWTPSARTLDDNGFWQECLHEAVLDWPHCNPHASFSGRSFVDFLFVELFIEQFRLQASSRLNDVDDGGPPEMKGYGLEGRRELGVLTYMLGLRV